jgi:hypothetical protein
MASVKQEFTSSSTAAALRHYLHLSSSSGILVVEEVLAQHQARTFQIMPGGGVERSILFNSLWKLTFSFKLDLQCSLDGYNT